MRPMRSTTDGRLEARWRSLAARTAWWGALCFAVLHQDLLEIPVLALLVVVFVGTLVTLPFRLVRRRAPA